MICPRNKDFKGKAACILLKAVCLEKLGIRQVFLADALVLLMRSEFMDINSD
jgi:hypothetical protein